MFDNPLLSYFSVSIHHLIINNGEVRVVVKIGTGGRNPQPQVCWKSPASKQFWNSSVDAIIEERISITWKKKVAYKTIYLPTSIRSTPFVRKARNKNLSHRMLSHHFVILCHWQYLQDLALEDYVTKTVLT